MSKHELFESLASMEHMEMKGRMKFISICLSFLLFHGFCIGGTIDSAVCIRDNETVTSENGNFILGFFSPKNSSDRYLGIWFGIITEQTVVWVANREDPVKNPSGILKIRQDGNLAVVDGNGVVHWSSNTSFPSNNTVAELLDSGNLILRNGNSSSYENRILWQSFDYPSDVFLPAMKFGLNLRTGENQLLRAWKSNNDPNPGNYSLGFDPNRVTQIIMWESSSKYWRSGLWNGQKFVGVPGMTSFELYSFNIITDKDAGRLYAEYANLNKSIISSFKLSSLGKLERSYWNYEALAWNVVWSRPDSECEFYGKCGPNGKCNNKKKPICSCLNGFRPYSAREWNSGNWSGGCIRKTALECNERSSNEGFVEVQNVKLPDNSQSEAIEGIDECSTRCKNNCSCTGFAFESGLGCLTWYGDLKDIQKFPSGGGSLYLRLAKQDLPGKRTRTALLVSAVAIPGIFVSVVYAIYIFGKIKRETGSNKKNQSQELFFSDLETPKNSNRYCLEENKDEVCATQGKGPDLPSFGLDILKAATGDFSLANKLGVGGFGHVYKGTLPSGREVAVKRLSKNSGQGLQEFENEVVLIAKLQHRNLVRLLGYCLEGDEKILVYEFLPNKSLNSYLFDPTKRALLNWGTRFGIIEGIARGLLYLHRDSRLRIIHRDLKAGNILLDKDMNPKISDFGMARIFGGKENQENTVRIVGTYGYMSPEYAMEGLFSVKSDVYSFGVLLIEIVSGKRNAGFYHAEMSLNLLGYAWELWNEDKVLDLVDPFLQDSHVIVEVQKCTQIGLLCVQENAADRPTMDSVLFMLGSEAASLPAPKKPAFSMGQTPGDSDVCASSSVNYSVNGVTISTVTGR